MARSRAGTDTPTDQKPEDTATPSDDSNDNQHSDTARENPKSPSSNGEAAMEDGGGDGSNDKDENAEEATPAKSIKLYKSPRFKGYFFILLSSIINYRSVAVSTDTSDISAVVPSSEQVAYGITVSLISCIATGLCVLVHLDNCSCFKELWKTKLFAPKSKFESMLDVFLLLWWFIAVCIQTGVRGIAGDGKEQYNIYYSTWFCTVAALFCLESKITEFGFPSFKKFIKSWPNRAPGWIAILITDFFVIFWYVDLYVNTKQHPERVADQLQPAWDDIPSSQYEWLIFVASATLLPAAAFIFAEIFRDSSQENSEKSSLETNIEGLCLLGLMLAWIPSVIVTTTPGGFAAYVGNAYFFTWGTTVFVMETAMWFIHDSRGGVHQMILKKEEEYRQHQQDVLDATRKMQMEAMNGGSLGVDGDARDNNELHDSSRRETDDAPIFGQDVTISEAPAAVSFAGIKEAPASSSAADGSRFEMRNETEEDEEGLDDTIKREMQQRETDKRAYFDTLDDILE